MDTSKFEDIVKFAIAREEAAYRTYGELSEKAETPGLKELLLGLQADEKNHKKILQDLTEKKVDSFETHKVIDLKISDYLTEEPPTSDMSFQDLLILAAKKEQEAVELYTNMREAVKPDDLKKLFNFLIEQEKTHKLRLETEYEKHVLGEG